MKAARLVKHAVERTASVSLRRPRAVPQVLVTERLITSALAVIMLNSPSGVLSQWM